MNSFRTISRVLAVSAVAFIANVGAVCPAFQSKAFQSLQQNKATIASVITANHYCAKDEHLKKAFIVTVAAGMENKLTSEAFGERLAVDYAIRRGSEFIKLDALRDAMVKKCDVLPEGIIRDNVNPVVEGTAAVVTDPEFITYLAMQYAIPTLVNMLKSK